MAAAVADDGDAVALRVTRALGVAHEMSMLRQQEQELDARLRAVRQAIGERVQAAADARAILLDCASILDSLPPPLPPAEVRVVIEQPPQQQQPPGIVSSVRDGEQEAPKKRRKSPFNKIARKNAAFTCFINLCASAIAKMLDAYLYERGVNSMQNPSSSSSSSATTSAMHAAVAAVQASTSKKRAVSRTLAARNWPDMRLLIKQLVEYCHYQPPADVVAAVAAILAGESAQLTTAPLYAENALRAVARESLQLIFCLRIGTTQVSIEGLRREISPTATDEACRFPTPGSPIVRDWMRSWYDVMAEHLPLLRALDAPAPSSLSGGSSNRPATEASKKRSAAAAAAPQQQETSGGDTDDDDYYIGIGGGGSGGDEDGAQQHEAAAVRGDDRGNIDDDDDDDGCPPMAGPPPPPPKRVRVVMSANGTAGEPAGSR